MKGALNALILQIKVLKFRKNASLIYNLRKSDKNTCHLDLMG